MTSGTVSDYGTKKLATTNPKAQNRNEFFKGISPLQILQKKKAECARSATTRCAAKKKLVAWQKETTAVLMS